MILFESVVCADESTRATTECQQHAVCGALFSQRGWRNWGVLDNLRTIDLWNARLVSLLRVQVAAMTEIKGGQLRTEHRAALLISSVRTPVRCFKENGGEYKKINKKRFKKKIVLRYTQSQCSTTGVTKAVVCAVLYVGWCIYVNRKE